MLFTDTQLDLSTIPGAVFQPAVPTGLRLFSLLGGTLAASLANMAIPANTSTSAGSPTILTPAGIQGPSGNIILHEGAESTGSETLFFVAQCVPSTPTALNSRPFGQLADYTQGTGFAFSSGQPGPTSFIGNTANGFWSQLSLTNGDGNYQTSATQQAIVATPQCYMLVIDEVAQTVTFKNLSQVLNGGNPGWSQSGGVNGTRVVNASAYQVPIVGYDNGAVSTLYAAVKYSAALTQSQYSSVYAQLKRILNNRGVTI